MEGFGSYSMQGVSVAARHFFGVNTSVKDSIYLVQDDNVLLYVAGHNVIMYKLDEKEQFFMPGKRMPSFCNRLPTSLVFKALTIPRLSPMLPSPNPSSSSQCANAAPLATRESLASLT